MLICSFAYSHFTVSMLVKTSCCTTYIYVLLLCQWSWTDRTKERERHYTRLLSFLKINIPKKNWTLFLKVYVKTHISFIFNVLGVFGGFAVSVRRSLLNSLTRHNWRKGCHYVRTERPVFECSQQNKSNRKATSAEHTNVAKQELPNIPWP